jgi:hypothetical protein
MVLTNQAITAVYIQRNKTPADQRIFGLSHLIILIKRLIKRLSPNIKKKKKSAGESLLLVSVIKLDELLTGTSATRSLIAEQRSRHHSAPQPDTTPPGPAAVTGSGSLLGNHRALGPAPHGRLPGGEPPPASVTECGARCSKHHP